jgi:hypothetical protein
VTLIRDVQGNGLANRLVFTGLLRLRSTLSIRHDHLISVEMSDPLWARLLDAPDLVCNYLDSQNNVQRLLVRGAGSKEECALVCSDCNGSHRTPRILPHTLPPSFANTPQAQQNLQQYGTQPRKAV